MGNVVNLGIVAAPYVLSLYSIRSSAYCLLAVGGEGSLLVPAAQNQNNHTETIFIN